MRLKKTFVTGTMLAGAMTALSFMSAGAAQAQGALVMYCGVQEEWCRAMVNAFERETGIKVSMTRKSAGEVYAQVKAEAANPARRHLVGRHGRSAYAGGRGRPDRGVQVAQDGRAAGLGRAPVGAVQAAHGRHLFRRARLRLQHRARASRKASREPKCWADLLNAKLKDEVQVADPNSSGTAYTLLATIVQIMGEDKGFEYLKALHKNVNQYTKSGAAPAKAMALGETTVGIAFMHDIVTMVVDKAPVKVVAPCEGTGYEIGSMSIIKGAKNLDNAKKFYDWALTPAAQKLGADAKSYQVPSNKSTPVPPQAPKLSDIKLINFDFAKYGSSAERKRLLSKWDNEVKNLPK